MNAKKQTVLVPRVAIFTGRYCHRECLGLNNVRLGWWCGYWRQSLDLDPENGEIVRCRQCRKATEEAKRG